MGRPNKLPVVLTQKEAIKLLSQPNKRYPTGHRNYAMLVAMYRAGLRVSELISLKARHIDANRNIITVIEGKGAKDRNIKVEPWVIDALLTWNAKRLQLPDPDKEKRLFVTLQGRQLRDRYVRTMVKREAAAAGIDKDIHPHTLRHTYATELLEAGYTIIEVQEQLGHSFVSTTQIYTHVTKSHLDEKTMARHEQWQRLHP